MQFKKLISLSSIEKIVPPKCLCTSVTDCVSIATIMSYIMCGNATVSLAFEVF